MSIYILNTSIGDNKNKSNMQNIRLVDIVLKMWEKTMVSESLLNPETGKYQKSGKKIENTTYHFIDKEGNKLTFLSDESKYRELEGSNGVLIVSLVHDDFKRINKIKFLGFVEN